MHRSIEGLCVGASWESYGPRCPDVETREPVASGRQIGLGGRSLTCTRPPGVYARMNRSRWRPETMKHMAATDISRRLQQ